MNTYLENYWAIYREFIETFKNFTFKDIPISLLTNFYQHIDQDLKMKMEADNFPVSEKYPELKQEMIQPYFEKWLAKSNPPSTNKPKDGKILINFDYTRIPETCYQTLFDPEKTIILSRSKNKQIFGIPTETMQKYEESTEDISSQLVNDAKALFGKLKNHPAFGNEFFQQTFLNRIPIIVKTISAAFNLFDQLTISAIIVGTTEDIVSRSLAIVGSICGIKSICLQHGILMGEEAFMPVFTSSVAVYGEYEKNWYLQRGLTQERISEIGHPKYDEIFTKITANNTTNPEKFEIDPNKITLLVITGPNIDAARITELIKSLISNSNYQLIIKPHPWEIAKQKCDLYLELEKKYKSIKVLTSRENYLYELIGHVDGVIATLSTVVLESILFKKPVFLFNFLNSNRTYDYFDQLGEFVQPNPNHLYMIVNQYYTSPEQKQAYDRIREQYLSSIYMDGTSGQKLLYECYHN